MRTLRRGAALMALAGLTMTVPASCSSGGSTNTATGAACVVGHWTSTSMTAPTQSNVGDITQTGGGSGVKFTFSADHTGAVDFSGMRTITADFTVGEQAGTLTLLLGGKLKGSWAVTAAGAATFTPSDFTTATGDSELTLGVTEPPIFQDTFANLNQQRMFNGDKIGVFTSTSCQGNALVLTSPFVNGVLTVKAKRG